jgi:lysophospholipase
MSKELMFQTFDGMKLFLKSDIPANPKAIAIIVHGLCEHQGRYDYITKKLTDQNYGVYRFDHRGHGRSEGKPAFYNDFDELIADVDAVVEYTQKENPKLGIFLIGHSLGGFAVTTFGMKHPNKARGIVSSGAVVRLNQPFPVPPDLPVDTYFPNELGEGVCSDPAVVDAYKNDPLVGKEISAGLFYSLFAGIDWNKDNSSLFVDPVLILHGCNDGLVSEKDSRDLYGDISSADKTLKIYAFLFHEIFNEPNKDKVIDDVIQWLDQRL